MADEKQALQLNTRMFWSEEKLQRRADELKRYVARQQVTVAPVRFQPGDVLGGEAVAFDDADWAVVEPYQAIFQEVNQLVWFRATVNVPAELSGKQLALSFPNAIARGGHDNQAESLLYLNGHPYHGIDRNHTVILLPEALCQGSFSMAIQAWAGRREPVRELLWQAPQLIWFDAETNALAYDLDTLRRSARVLEKTDARRFELLKLAEQAMLVLDWTVPGSDRFYESVREARAISNAGLERLAGTEALKPTVTHIGHTHLDVAWLWTLDNIKLKTARSWASALRLMTEFPDFKWIQSQPQLYKYIKETQPEIWQQVKQRVADGRWEAEGGMWVEADTNLSGGESLVRQFLYGTRFFHEEFGVENLVLWLPDVFGYAWALPQIIRKSGLKYFMTTKIAWNQFNRFPYDTFKWRGIDGTEVLTHYITAPTERRPDSWFYTYNANVFPETVKGNWELYQQKEHNTETLSSFGFGDGGGGPTREMMEYAERLKDMPGIPRVQIGKVADFFTRLDTRVGSDPSLPVWDGELYLEYHRGTYTSQAQQKRRNRKSEFLLHNAELYAAAAASLIGAPYPKSDLDEAWEIVLRNQFHDIIPGSSIHEVYEDSAKEYQRVFALGGGVLSGSTRKLASGINLAEESLVVFNPTGISRSDVVEADLPAGMAPVDEQGNPLSVQGNLVYVPEVPANGYRTFALRPATATAVAGATTGLTVTAQRIETPYHVLELNAQGQIARLYDKANEREVLPAGSRANVLQAFEDKPMNFDAWDIDIYYQQKGREVQELIEAQVEEAGPERGVLKLVWRFEGSTITQRLTVYAHNPRIDFDTHVDWQLSQVLLKAAFPVEVRSTRATYDIQFGNVERPTHWNTSWDWARFETCGHKWADLSEGGYGVSLLNDCKYGHDIKDNVMRLTLIKSAIGPDPVADRGEHRFTYSLYPHAEDWFQGGTVAQAYRLNNPLLAVRESAHPGSLPTTFSLVSCDAANVMIETVKQSESGDRLVVRVYEFGNRRGKAELRFGRPVLSAVETNLMENEPQPVAANGDRVAFQIKPYEIKTFVVQLG